MVLMCLTISDLQQLVCCFFLAVVTILDFLTCFHVFELLLELLWGQAVVVESIIPFDSLQHLQVTTHQPITSLHDHLAKVINREYYFLIHISSFTLN